MARVGSMGGLGNKWIQDSGAWDISEFLGTRDMLDKWLHLITLPQRRKHSTFTSLCVLLNTFHTYGYCSGHYKRWYGEMPALSGAWSRDGLCNRSSSYWATGSSRPCGAWGDSSGKHHLGLVASPGVGNQGRLLECRTKVVLSAAQNDLSLEKRSWAHYWAW